MPLATFMKATTLLVTALFAATLNSSAQLPRYVTVTASGTNAYVSVQPGETGELITCEPLPSASGIPVQVQKDGVWFNATPAVFHNYLGGPLVTASGVGTTVAGPATFRLWAGTSLMTVKITPESYDPNKTLIVPPGTNQVQITLESSTNLVSWATATNGVYGSPDAAHFFRIRMDKLASP
jgi:hypothetical protein